MVLTSRQILTYIDKGFMPQEISLKDVIRQADVTSLEYKLYHIGLEHSGITTNQINQRLAELSKPIKGYTLSQRRVIGHFLREQLTLLANQPPKE